MAEGGGTSSRSPPSPLPSDPPPNWAVELSRTETLVNSTLEANRGLVEAYWRVRMLAEEAGRLGQPLSLPSHEELSLQALIVQGQGGRRAVPSELEKALSREKQWIEMQLTQTKSELIVTQTEVGARDVAGVGRGLRLGIEIGG